MNIISIATIAIIIFSHSASAHDITNTTLINTSDNCTQIMEKFDNTNSGSTIFFPSGTYDISCFLGYTINKSLTIEGQLGETLLDGKGKTGFKLEEGLKYFSVRNIRFTNFNRVFTHTVIGITLHRLEFDNIEITNSQSGIHLSAHVNEAWIKNSSFSNIISNNERANSAIFIGYKDNDSVDIPEGAGRIHVINNNFTNLARDSGLSDFHAILIRGNQVNISNNIIRHFSCNATTACEAIYAHADKSMVTNNNIYNAEGGAVILLKGHSVGAKHHQIKNNLVVTDGVDANFINNAAIEIQVPHAVVSNNSIYNPIGYAILEKTGKLAPQIIDNHIYNPRFKNVIRVRGSDAIISGNSITRPIINTLGQVKLIQVDTTNNSDIENVVISNNTIIVDNQLSADDLFVIYLYKQSNRVLSNVVIKDNIINNISANIIDQLVFIKDNAVIDEIDSNNTVIGF